MTWTKHSDLTKEMCDDLFYYSDGKLIRKRTVAHTAKKGQVVGSRSTNGYLTVVIRQKRTCIHRVIFLMHHGFLPKIVDHINGKKDDNRIENLRASDYTKNGLSHRQLKSGKTSKYRGVCYAKRDKSWEAKIKFKGKTYRIGGFKNEIDAAKAYDERAFELVGEHATLNFPR